MGFLILPVIFVHSLDCSTVHEIAITSEDLKNELVVLVYNGVSGVDDLRWRVSPSKFVGAVVSIMNEVYDDRLGVEGAVSWISVMYKRADLDDD